MLILEVLFSWGVIIGAIILSIAAIRFLAYIAPPKSEGDDDDSPQKFDDFPFHY